jgi:putative ABC transport system permease protein
VLSVALATTLWTAVTRVAFSSVESFEESIGLNDERFAIRVSSRGGRMSSQRVAAALMTLPAVSDVVFITRESGLIARVTEAAQHGESSPIMVVGLGGIGSRVVTPMAEDTAAISENTMRSLGLKVGDAVALRWGTEPKVFKVALLPKGDQALFARAAVVSLERFSSVGSVDEVLIAPRRNVSLSQVIQDLEVWVRSSSGSDLITVEPITAPIERARAVTAAYRLNIFIVAAMSLCVCALLVYQATQLSLIALSREVSILSALGLSASELGSALVLEAAIASACGAMLGLLVGYPVTITITNSLLETAYDLYGVEFSVLSRGDYALRALATILTVTVVGSLSATAAAIRAVSGSVSHGARRERVHVRPISRGLALTATATTSAIMVVCLVWLRLSPTVVLTYLAVGFCLIWVAGTALGALAVVPGFLISRSSGLSRMLAGSHLRRSGGSYAFGVIASAVAIALMTSLACMVGSFRGTLRDWSRIRLQGDLFVSSAISGDGHESRIGQGVVNGIREDPEVSRVVAYRETRDSVNGRDVIVAGTDIRAQCARGVYIFVNGSCEEVQNHDAPFVLISESAARKGDLSRGDLVLVRRRPLRVAGVLREFGTEQPLFVTDESLFNDLYDSPDAKTLTIDLRDASRVEMVRESLERRYKEPIVVRNHRELLGLVEDIFNRTFTVTDSVRWVVFVLAFAGLVSGYLQHAWERRVDLRVLDVQGASHGEWTIMFCVEAITIVAVSIVAGGVGGVMLGYILTEYLNPLVFGWRLHFDIGSAVVMELVGFMLICVVSMVAGALFVVRRIRRSVGLRDE